MVYIGGFQFLVSLVYLHEIYQVTYTRLGHLPSGAPLRRSSFNGCVTCVVCAGVPLDSSSMQMVSFKPIEISTVLGVIASGRPLTNHMLGVAGVFRGSLFS